MVLQALIQVLGDAGVVLVRMAEALDDVNVLHGGRCYFQFR